MLSMYLGTYVRWSRCRLTLTFKCPDVWLPEFGLPLYRLVPAYHVQVTSQHFDGVVGARCLSAWMDLPETKIIVISKDSIPFLTIWQMLWFFSHWYLSKTTFHVTTTEESTISQIGGNLVSVWKRYTVVLTDVVQFLIVNYHPPSSLFFGTRNLGDIQQKDVGMGKCNTNTR